MSMVLATGSMIRKMVPNVIIAAQLLLARRRIALLVAIVLLSMPITGCSNQTQHKILTFFFTGVPPLEEQSVKKTEPSVTAVVSPPQGQKTGIDGTIADASVEVPLPIVPEAPRLFSHAVWVEGECSSCHEGSNTFGFAPVRKQVKSDASKVFYAGGGMPGKLNQPKEKICLPCHKDKSGLRAIKDQLWLHNPVAKGECLACHDAHQGKYKGVLREAPDQLCSSCHPEETLVATAMHRNDDTPCLSCHNPHMGRDRNLLTKDYQEVEQAAKHAM